MTESDLLTLGRCGARAQRSLRIRAAAFSATLAAAVCSAAGAATPMRIELKQPFTVGAGVTAQVGHTAWQFGFDSVSSDSRCPKGEQCIAAGEATVSVWLRQGSGPQQVLQLSLASDSARAVGVVAGHELRLIRLDPYPVANKPMAAAEYAATLVLTRPTSGSPAR